MHVDDQGVVRKHYEDGNTSNDDEEPDFYLEDDGAGGSRRVYIDGHESNDDDTATGLSPTIAIVSILDLTATIPPVLHPFGSWPFLTLTLAQP